jgi:hypothetical protein
MLQEILQVPPSHATDTDAGVQQSPAGRRDFGSWR